LFLISFLSLLACLPEAFAALRLCEPFFFSSRKACLSANRAPSRNWGNSLPIRRGGPGQALEKGAGCLSRRIAGPPRRISFSRKGAKPQRNLTANGSNLLVLVSYFFALGTLYLVLGTLYLLLDTDYLLLFLMSNAERPVQNGEVGNSAHGKISYFFRMP
jgi:hypothetical protein